MQHHDGITGTESPKVADMYLQHLTQAMMGVEELLAALFLLPHHLDIPSMLSSRYHRKSVLHKFRLNSCLFKRIKDVSISESFD